ncbi:MAG TPA: molybdopterin dinucleotide binding domain-containing protein, partial [Blastocatellia bacterium]|nr:molybdopterin dinucleotide binding domain-containing protein [Blastocatellia bacterium]
LIMIHGFNPMFSQRGWREDLLGTPFFVSFSSFMEETSELADLLLPDHNYLERWDLKPSYGPDGSRVFSLTQPVIEPQLNTRHTADVLLAVARELGGDVGKALPFDSAKDIIEKGAVALVQGAWSELTDKGLVSTGAPAPVKGTTADEAPMSFNTFILSSIRNNVSGGSTNAEYPMTLIVYEHAAFGDGKAANLPSIQELPDPLTSVIWGSWIEINPKTAASMGLADGDLVEVTTINGSVRAPAILYPAIRPDTVAMPFGQGHTSYGRYARGRGANPASLLGGSFRGRGEETIQARVTRVGGEVEIIRFGTELMEQMEFKR